jgi:23S rRNA pseudouridine1911/1915/1917 synthase
VYEDEYLLMINKAAGMAVHPGPGNPDGTVVNAVLHHCNGQLSGIGGVERPGIVHRIDMDTSGLLVVAKDDNTHQHLSAQLKARTLKREYTAFVWGSFSQKSGMIEGHIGRSPTNRKKMAVVMRGGKEARTHYQVEERVMYNGSPFVSHITCQLETGRTHQIRVHCSHEGHSLVGDPVYGSCRKWPKTFPEKLLSALELFQRQALHARELQLIHPHTNQTMRFDAALPQDMANLWRLFKDLS